MKYVTIISLLIAQIQFGEAISYQKLSYNVDINNFIDKVHFNLYTQQNQNHPDVIDLFNETTFLKSNYRVNKTLKIYIHGWSGDPYTEESLLVKNAYLKISDVNVIIVDWKQIAYGSASYVIRISQDVSVFIAEFIDWITIFGIKHSDIHLIGASLGGTMAGFVGRSLKKGMIPYITACDPPQFRFYIAPMNVNRNDGAYVEIIHSDWDFYGLRLPQGHTDFYPNGGVDMPGCQNHHLKHDCSHLRAYEYFCDSLDHKGYIAEECKNFEEIENGNCSKLSRLHLGGVLPKNATGIYYLETYADKPYHKGIKTHITNSII